MTGLDPIRDPKDSDDVRDFLLSVKDDPVAQPATESNDVRDFLLSTKPEPEPEPIAGRVLTGDLSFFHDEDIEAESGVVLPDEQPPIGAVIAELGKTTTVGLVKGAEAAVQTGLIDVPRGLMNMVGADLPEVTARELMSWFEGNIADPFSGKTWDERLKDATDRADAYTAWESKVLEGSPAARELGKLTEVGGHLTGFVLGAPGKFIQIFGKAFTKLAASAPVIGKMLSGSARADKAAKVLASSAGFAGLYAVEDRDILDGALLGAAFSFIGTFAQKIEKTVGGVGGRATAGFLEGSTLLPFAATLEGDPSFINFVKAVASGNMEEIEHTYADFLRSGIAFAIFKSLAPSMQDRHRVQEAPGWNMQSSKRGYTLEKGKEKLEVILDEGEIVVKGNSEVARRLWARKRRTGVKPEDRKAFEKSLKGEFTPEEMDTLFGGKAAPKKGVLLKGAEALEVLRDTFKESRLDDLIAQAHPRALTQEEWDTLPPELTEGAESAIDWLRSPDVAASLNPETAAVAELAVDMIVKGAAPGDATALLMSPEFKQAMATAKTPEEFLTVANQLLDTASGISTVEQAWMALEGRPEVKDAERDESAPLREQVEAEEVGEERIRDLPVGDRTELQDREVLEKALKDEFTEEELDTLFEDAPKATPKQTEKAFRGLIAEAVRPGTFVSEDDAVAVLSGIPMPESAVKGARGGLRFWTEPLLDKVGRQNVVGRTLERLGRVWTGRVRSRRGLAEDTLTKFLKGTTTTFREMVGQVRSRKFEGVPYELNKLIPIHAKAHGMVGQLAADKVGKYYDQLSPEAREMVDLYHKLQLQTGQWFVDAKAKIKVRTRKAVQDKDGNWTTKLVDEWIDFTVDPNRWRFVRNLTFDAFDMFEQGKGPAYEVLVEVLADLNPKMGGAKKVRKTLEKMRERGVFRRNAAELERVFEQFPAAITVGSSTVPLLDTSFAMAGQRLVQQASMRSTFIELFGQDTKSPGDIESSQWVKDFEKAGGTGQDAINLLRALNGMPLETPPKWLKVGTLGYVAYRRFKLLDSLRRTGLLTKAVVPNIPEPLGNIPAFIGTWRLMRAYMDIMVSGAEGIKNWNAHERFTEVWREGARMGALTTDIPDWTVHYGRKMEDIQRMARLANVPLRLVSEFNDLVAYKAAEFFVKDLKSGNVSRIRDRRRLEMLKFSPDEVKLLMTGKASEALFQEVQKRAPAFTQFMDQLAPEASRARGSWTWNALFFAEMFAQGKFRRMVEITSKTGEASKKWLDNHTVDNFKEALGQTALAMNFYVGTGASAALSIYGKSILAYGLAGFWSTKIGVGEAIGYGLFGGVFSAIDRILFDNFDEENIVWQFAQIATPVSLIHEASNFILGAGAYSDNGVTKAPLEAASIFLDRNIAISRNARSAIAAIGLGSVDREMDIAMRDYYKWRRDNAPLPKGGKGKPDEIHAFGTVGYATNAGDQSLFRRNMRKVADMLKDGVHISDDKIKELLKEAKGVRSRESVRASLLRRRIFDGGGLSGLTREQRADLKEYLGPTSIRKIQRFDSLLEHLAQRYKTFR